MPASLQNAYTYIFPVCSSQQSCTTPKDAWPEVTEVVSGRARSNLASNDFKFHVPPAVSSRLPAAKGVVKIILQKRDETALDNLGVKEGKLSSLSHSQSWSVSSFLRGSTPGASDMILSFVLVYVFPVASRGYFLSLLLFSAKSTVWLPIKGGYMVCFSFLL